MVAKGRADPRRPTWYAPDRRAWTWSWKPEYLNDSQRAANIRKERWPELPPRRARVTSVLDRLSARCSAWDEARDLQHLRSRRAKIRLPHSSTDLAYLTRRTTAAVEHSLKIASTVSPAILEAAAVGPDQLKLLSRAALYRVARAPDDPGRVQALKEELRRARERDAA